MKNIFFGLVEKLIIIALLSGVGILAYQEYQTTMTPKNESEKRKEALDYLGRVMMKIRPDVRDLKEFIRTDIEAMLNQPDTWFFKVEIHPLAEFKEFNDWNDGGVRENPAHPLVVRLYEDEKGVIKKISGSPTVWAPMALPAQALEMVSAEKINDYVKNHQEKIDELAINLEKILKKGNSLTAKESDRLFLKGYGNQEKLVMKSYAVVYATITHGLLKYLKSIPRTQFTMAVEDVDHNIKNSWVMAYMGYMRQNYADDFMWEDKKRAIVFKIDMVLAGLTGLFFLYHLFFPTLSKLFGKQEYVWSMREKINFVLNNIPACCLLLWRREKIIKRISKRKIAEKNKWETGCLIGQKARETFDTMAKILSGWVPKEAEGEYRTAIDEKRDLEQRSEALHALQTMLARAPTLAKQSKKTKMRLLVPAHGVREGVEMGERVFTPEDERKRGKGKKILKPHEQRSLLDAPPPLSTKPAKNGHVSTRVNLSGKKVAVLVGNWTKKENVKKRFEEILQGTFQAQCIFIDIFDVPKLEKKMRDEKPDFCIVYSNVANHIGFWKAKEILFSQGKPTSNVLLLSVINERRIKEELMKKAQ